MSTLDAARDSGYRKDGNILLFRHPKDSHNPERIGTHPVNTVTDSTDEIYKSITPKTRNIIIAGAAHYDSEITLLVDALVRSNRNVIITGTNLDIHGQPYGRMPDLMALADDVILTKAFCYKSHCNESEANRSVKIGEQFDTACADHYYYPDSPPVPLNYAGRLVMDLGPMYSDKTRKWSNRIKQVERKNREKVIFRYLHANRYGEPKGELFAEGCITLNTGEKIPGAILIETADHMREYLRSHPKIKEVFRDETQFVKGIYDFSLEYLAQGYNFHDTGLLRGFNRQRFGEVSQLMCLADVIEMGYATCVPCGHPATENQRMRKEAGRVFPADVNDPMDAPGGTDGEENSYFYEARCIGQWVLRGELQNKFQLERHVP